MAADIVDPVGSPVEVYRRTRDRMPAHETELEETLEEGVKVKWLSTITGAEGRHLTIERMVLDADGKPQGFALTGTVRARSTSLVNPAVRDFLGGNASGSSQLLYGPDGIVRFSRLRVSACRAEIGRASCRERVSSPV